MSNRRQTQHRQQRDTNNQEIASLKKEVDQLTRQVARLRKENDRLMSLDSEKDPDPEPVAETVKVKATPSCPKCGSPEISTIPLPSGKSVRACRSCREWKSKPT